MKRKFGIVALVLMIMVLPCFGETYGQVANRARRFDDEWNSLCGMQEKLNGESYINLRNYMMGFAEGAYKTFEDLYSMYGDNWYYEEYEFYFNQYQIAVKYCGGKTANFREYYYFVGCDRSFYGKRRLGINDF